MYGYQEAISQEIDFFQGHTLEEDAEKFKVWVCYRLLRIWNLKYHEKPVSLFRIRRELTLSPKYRLIINNTNAFSITDGIITIDIRSINNQNRLNFEFFNTICGYWCGLELNLQHSIEFIDELFSISQQMEKDARTWAMDNYKNIRIKEIERTTESAYVYD